mgnify:FL=1
MYPNCVRTPYYIYEEQYSSMKMTRNDLDPK